MVYKLTNNNNSVLYHRLPSSLKGRLAGPTAAYDENERIHILMAITLARFLSEQELTSDPKPIFSETICSKIREIIKWPYFASKVRPRGANPVPSNNAIRHIWYCLQTHGTAHRPPVKPKRRKASTPRPRLDCPNFVQLPIENTHHNRDNRTLGLGQGAAPADWPLFGRDFT